jgi:hypothetical protein
MFVPVADDESAAAASASVSVTYMPVPMVRCNAMAWTDEMEGRLLKVLVTRSDPIAGTVTVTEERSVPRVRFTGTTAEKCFMECKWCEKLWQAMSRVEKRKSITTARAVERAAKRQCKKDERQKEALLAKERNWSAHVFDPQSAESVTRKAAASSTRYQRACTTRMAVFWQGNFYLENNDVSCRNDCFKRK